MVFSMSKNTLQAIAMILLVIGGLNWGLVGLLNFNLVTFCFGTSVVTKIVYCLVALSAVYMVIAKFKK